MKLKKFFFKKVISTNDTAVRLIKLGNEKGAILSEHQSKGRGQRGNKWTSKKGNLFMTVFFEISKKLSVKKIINLNILIIKNIISKKIRSILNIKKPNDIFINKKTWQTFTEAEMNEYIQKVFNYYRKIFLALSKSMGVSISHHLPAIGIASILILFSINSCKISTSLAFSSDIAS